MRRDAAVLPRRAGDRDRGRERPVGRARPSRAGVFTLPWTGGPVTSFTRAGARRGREPERRAQRAVSRPSHALVARARAARGSRPAARAGRGRPRRRPATAPADVDADPEHDAARSPRRGCPPPCGRRRRTSFGSLIVAPSPIAPATASRGDERQLRPARDGRRRPQDDREREAGARLVDPDSPEPAAPLGLVLGDRDGAVRRVRRRASAASSGVSAA